MHAHRDLAGDVNARGKMCGSTELLTLILWTADQCGTDMTLNRETNSCGVEDFVFI